jgi:hypothetical protein
MARHAPSSARDTQPKGDRDQPVETTDVRPETGSRRASARRRTTGGRMAIQVTDRIAAAGNSSRDRSRVDRSRCPARQAAEKKPRSEPHPIQIRLTTGRGRNEAEVVRHPIQDGARSLLVHRQPRPPFGLGSNGAGPWGRPTDQDGDPTCDCSRRLGRHSISEGDHPSCADSRSACSLGPAPRGLAGLLRVAADQRTRSR